MLMLMLLLLMLVLLRKRYHDCRGQDGDGLFKVGEGVAK